MTLKQYAVLVSVFIIFITAGKSESDEYLPAPYDIQSAILFKTLAFNKSLSGNVTVYVYGSDAFAASLEKGIGKTSGSITLAAVHSGNALPATPPDIIYIGNEKFFDEAIEYTRKHNIMSMTGIPELVKKGVSIGVCVQQKKPMILLNLKASKEEHIQWNLAILKVAVLFE